MNFCSEFRIFRYSIFGFKSRPVASINKEDVNALSYKEIKSSASIDFFSLCRGTAIRFTQRGKFLKGKQSNIINYSIFHIIHNNKLCLTFKRDVEETVRMKSFATFLFLCNAKKDFSWAISKKVFFLLSNIVA